MTIATKNGSVILKSGSVAENCGCCGGWQCYKPESCDDTISYLRNNVPSITLTFNTSGLSYTRTETRTMNKVSPYDIMPCGLLRPLVGCDDSVGSSWTYTSQDAQVSQALSRVPNSTPLEYRHNTLTPTLSFFVAQQYLSVRFTCSFTNTPQGRAYRLMVSVGCTLIYPGWLSATVPCSSAIAAKVYGGIGQIQCNALTSLVPDGSGFDPCGSQFSGFSANGVASSIFGVPCGDDAFTSPNDPNIQDDNGRTDAIYHHRSLYSSLNKTDGTFSATIGIP